MKLLGVHARWWALALALLVGAEAWRLAHNSSRVRVSVYNDLPDPLAGITLRGGSQRETIPLLEPEESRTVVFNADGDEELLVTLSCVQGDAHAVLPSLAGDRLLIRIRPGGEIISTRSAGMIARIGTWLRE